MGLPGPPRAHLRAATTVLTALAALSTAALATAAAPPGAADGAKDVSYRGYHVRVPSSWPVIDLAAHPDTCVRFDRHAVYLGHATDAGQATCPAGLVGRTEALVIEPLDATSRKSVDGSTRIAPKGAARATAPRTGGAPSGRIRQAVPAAGVLVTASVGADDAAAQTILDSADLDAGAEAVTLSAAPAGRAETMSASAVAAQPDTYTGLGFDPCAAPSNAQMSAWSASPFRAIGVYISGISAACDQPNLTAPWIQTQTSAGWHIIPIHVGLQACPRPARTASRASSPARRTRQA
ncbi:glycoside hydrolase domain-containing protein [Streptomyces sp. NBC_01589]|uniref:glycoside hydrolase domain-containing protein n=1 Tax=unclassified Streptomyces TaxID=2593676 RepID=UPI00386351FC